jgi:acetylornithine/N-succinyldiaminopimelate aminotransferase
MHEIFQLDEKFVFQTYRREPLVLVAGKGAIVRDIEGKEYIDCVAGIGVNNVGHCHPDVVESIKKQAEMLMHTSNLYYNERQIELAELLSKLTGMGKLFFCNSGTEAIEAALKLARKISGKREFIAAKDAFHGRTMGSLSITYKEQYREPFEPLIPYVGFVPYNDPEAIKNKINDDTAAVILEPIQVESGGINIPNDEYLPAVMEICNEKNTLLILDEIQTGFGRTGKWFAKDHSDVKPDIMTMAKAMGGGFPIGAMASTDEIAMGFQAGDHASTFGGNPLACSAAIASIEVIKKEGLVERSAELGEYFINRLRNLELDFIREVRGKGLLIGIELTIDGEKVVNDFRENGVLVNCIGGDVIRLVPPLVITKKQIDEVLLNFLSSLNPNHSTPQ